MHIKTTGQQKQEVEHWRCRFPYFYLSQFWVSVNDATHTHVTINKNGIKNRSNKIKAREEQQSTELYDSYTFMYKRILETNFSGNIFFRSRYSVYIAMFYTMNLYKRKK